jgi:hypothetical protein
LSIESSAGSLTGERTLHRDSGGALATESADREQPAARRTQWKAGGWWGVVGFTTTRPPTSERVRVAPPTRPAVDDEFTLTLASVPGARTTTSRALTIGDVLRLWRAAERVLDSSDVGSPEYETARADVTELRALHHRLFDARR